MRTVLSTLLLMLSSSLVYAGEKSPCPDMVKPEDASASGVTKNITCLDLSDIKGYRLMSSEGWEQKEYGPKLLGHPFLYINTHGYRGMMSGNFVTKENRVLMITFLPETISKALP